MSKDDTKVLCLRRTDILPPHKYFNGFVASDMFRYQQPGPEQLKDDRCFIKRGECESEPSLKQIIPYVVVRLLSENEVDPQILLYRRSRSGGEGRLHDKWSLGFGGHIELQDKREYYIGTLYACAEREIKEELGLSLSSDLKLSPLGYLNDDHNPVGQVHFGVVFKLDINDSTEITLGEEIAEHKWALPKELMNLTECEWWTSLLGPVLALDSWQYDI